MWNGCEEVGTCVALLMSLVPSLFHKWYTNSRKFSRQQGHAGVNSKGDCSGEANCQLLIAADYILYKIKHAPLGNKYTVKNIKVKKCNWQRWRQWYKMQNPRKLETLFLGGRKQDRKAANIYTYTYYKILLLQMFLKKHPFPIKSKPWQIACKPHPTAVQNEVKKVRNSDRDDKLISTWWIPLSWANALAPTIALCGWTCIPVYSST